MGVGGEGAACGVNDVIASGCAEFFHSQGDSAFAWAGGLGDGSVGCISKRGVGVCAHIGLACHCGQRSDFYCISMSQYDRLENLCRVGCGVSREYAVVDNLDLIGDGFACGVHFVPAAGQSHLSDAHGCFQDSGVGETIGGVAPVSIVLGAVDFDAGSDSELEGLAFEHAESLAVGGYGCGFPLSVISGLILDFIT